ncbi:MAG: carboxypeptidase-like regulatory domain-containing protein [Muribaculaceae bacterium]|nr:carboxypeptidase-like regulatory domain-containing protein [Muribaculaceae bacterium]
MKNFSWRFSIPSIISLFILLLISSCSNSNDFEIFGSIHGVVTDHADGSPLDNATILLSPGGITKQTDASGHYNFDNLESQQYTLTVQRQGYQPNRKTISAIAGEDLQVDIQLISIPQ